MKHLLVFLNRPRRWHLVTDREESGPSAVWLEVEMAKLFQTKAQRQKKSHFVFTHGPTCGWTYALSNKNFVVHICIEKLS